MGLEHCPDPVVVGDGMFRRTVTSRSCFPTYFYFSNAPPVGCTLAGGG
jgi:hypothetical protein